MKQYHRPHNKNIYPTIFNLCYCGCNEIVYGENKYTPDFFLPRKEYMLPKAQEKINQFKEQYPWDLEILGLKELKLLGAV